MQVTLDHSPQLLDMCCWSFSCNYCQQGYTLPARRLQNLNLKAQNAYTGSADVPPNNQTPGNPTWFQW